MDQQSSANSGTAVQRQQGSSKRKQSLDWKLTESCGGVLQIIQSYFFSNPFKICCHSCLPRASLFLYSEWRKQALSYSPFITQRILLKTSKGQQCQPGA